MFVKPKNTGLIKKKSSIAKWNFWKTGKVDAITKTAKTKFECSLNVLVFQCVCLIFSGEKKSILSPMNLFLLKSNFKNFSVLWKCTIMIVLHYVFFMIYKTNAKHVWSKKTVFNMNWNFKPENLPVRVAHLCFMLASAWLFVTFIFYKGGDLLPVIRQDSKDSLTPEDKTKGVDQEEWLSQVQCTCTILQLPNRSSTHNACSSCNFHL